MKKIILNLLLIVLTLNIYAQVVGDYSSKASGNWSDVNTWQVCTTAGTWVGATSPALSAPTSLNNVYIQSGFTVTIDVDANCNNLIIGSGGTNGILEFETLTQRNLVVSGSLTTNSGASLGTLQITAFDQPLHTISVLGDVNNLGTINLWRTTNQKADLTINGISIIGNGSYTLNNLTLGGANVSWTSASQIDIYGDFVDNTTTKFTASNGLFNFNLGASQNINGTSTGNTTFNNLTVGSGNATNLILNRNLIVTDLTLNSSAEAISLNAKNLTINGSYVRTLGTIGGNSSSNLTFAGTASSQTVQFSTDFNINNLTFSSSSGTGDSYSLGSNLTVNGNFALSGNVLGIVTFNIGANNFTVNGTSSISNYGKFTDGLLAGTNIFIGAVTIGANGQWTTTNNPTFEFRNGLSYSGSLFTSGTGVYSFTTNNQSISGSATFAITNITISGITLTNLNTSGLTVNLFAGNGNLTNGLNGVLNINGFDTITNSGTIDFNTSLNTVNYLPNLVQLIYTTPYRNLQISGGSVKTLFNNTVVNGTLTLNAGNLAITGFTLTLNYNIVNNGGNILGSSTSNLIINDIGSATVANLNIASLNNFTLNRANGATLTGSMIIAGTTTLTLGNFSIGANTLTLSGDLTYGTGNLIGSTTSNLLINGAVGAPNIILPTITLNNFEINRTNGITLSGNMTVAGVITLRLGIITTNANAVILDNTTTSGFVIISTNSYIQGQLKRKFVPGMAAGTYTFPIGKSSFNGINLVTTVVTSGSGSTYITAEDFDISAGGTAGFDILSVGVVARYWTLQSSNNTVIIDNSTTLQINQAGLNATHTVAQSNTLTGTYTDKSGTVVGSIISTTHNSSIGYVIDYSFVTSASSTYFVIGTKITLGSGTILVGNSQSVKKLREISWLLNRYALTGNVIFEMQDDYDGTDEFLGSYLNTPITFNQYTPNTFTATIMLAAGVTSMKTTSGDPGSGNSLIVFNGVDNLIINGQVGANKWWTFRNTRTAATVGPTFRFTGDSGSNKDATFNTLTYLNIEGQNITAPASGALAGTINLYASAGTVGNDNNTISYCDIHENTAAVSPNCPSVAIFSDANAAGLQCDNLNINNCNIYNFFVNNVVSCGIWINNRNSNTCSITNNSFYQTSSRAVILANVYRAIYSGVGSNTITSNSIGGTAPLCAGTDWTISGAFTHQFYGIDVFSAAGNTVNIQNNKITNFDFTTTYATNTAPGAWCGIYISGAGNANVGVTAGAVAAKNTIGSTTASDVILVKPGSGAMVCGIASSATGNIKIKYNEIGGITNALTGAITTNLTGIATSGALGVYTIEYNILGGVSSPLKIGVKHYNFSL